MESNCQCYKVQYFGFGLLLITTQSSELLFTAVSICTLFLFFFITNKCFGNYPHFILHSELNALPKISVLEGIQRIRLMSPVPRIRSESIWKNVSHRIRIPFVIYTSDYKQVHFESQHLLPCQRLLLPFLLLQVQKVCIQKQKCARCCFGFVSGISVPG